MAKKKKAKAFSDDAITSGTAPFLQFMREANHGSGFDDIKIGSRVELDVGIPLPALSARFLFQKEYLPLERVYMFSGQEGSCKSSMLYQIMDWILDMKGCVFFAENELKDAPMLRASFLDWQKNKIERVLKYSSTSIEEWQKFLMTNMQAARTAQTHKDGMGKRMPLLFCLDSLMSTEYGGEIETIQKEGFATRGYAVAAYLVTKYIKALPQTLKGFPFIWVATNHLKPGMDAMGRPKNTTPGGKSCKFMQSFEVEMSRVKDLDYADKSGVQIRMMTSKNSNGRSRLSMTIELYWTLDPVDQLQRSTWDWHTASIVLLYDWSQKYATIRDAIREVTGIYFTNPSKKLCHSKKFGISKEEPISYAEMSKILEQHPEVLKELYPILGIQPCYKFELGRTYDDMKQEATISAEEVAKELATRAKTLPTIASVLPIDDDEDDMAAEMEASYESLQAEASQSKGEPSDESIAPAESLG